MEKILCIKRKLLPENWIKQKTALNIEAEQIVDSLANCFEFKDRDSLEKDYEYKQIIPYCIVLTRRNEIAIYPRKGSEKRLHGLWSAGIGGHISEQDKNDSEHSSNIMKIALTGLYRELSEEFANFNPQIAKKLNISFCGVINEEYSDVGRVHFGFVFKMVTDNKPKPGYELKGLKWVAIKELKNYYLELWSELALRCIFPA